MFFIWYNTIIKGDKKMKYKDILVGEWFQYGSNVFIKTKHPVYGLKNYIMENSLHFGENWGEMDDDIEVSYVAHRKIEFPFMWVRNATLANAVYKVPLCINETILIKDIFGGEPMACMIATNDKFEMNCGQWTKYFNNAEIKYTNSFEYNVIENT